MVVKGGGGGGLCRPWLDAWSAREGTAVHVLYVQYINGSLGCTTVEISSFVINKSMHFFSDPPEGTALSVANTTALKGSVVTFNCTTDAFPSPHEYKLYHEGNLLETNSSAVFKIPITQGGMYSCTPNNTVGIGDSATVTLTLVGECVHNTSYMYMYIWM